MPTRKNYPVFAIILVIAVCASLLNVYPVHADEGTPTEPPAPTQVATEPPADPPTESTPEPVEATPEPVEATATPLAEVITQIPESPNVVVLNENGDSVPLATQEAAGIVETTDPMWCPAGVLPGGAGCTTKFTSVNGLIDDMLNNTANYTQNGVIYFTVNPGIGTLNLSETTLTGDFDTLKNYSLTLQGGWNGSTSSPSLGGQTNFHTTPITIGSSGNPWVGNISLIDIKFSGVSGGNNAITVYTDNGDITLNNVDVQSQSGGGYVTVLDTNSGDILVDNGSTFQTAIVVNRGNGFSANSDTGSITISDTSFNNFRAPGAPVYNGAILSAPTITLTNVTANNNDGEGIKINGADIVTLNNVVANNNGTNPPGPVSNAGSGLLINGNVGSNIFVSGGIFNGNMEYGIEIANPAGTTIYVQSAPVCTGNLSGCSNGTFVINTTAPSLAHPTSTSGSGLSPLIIPVTGGKVIQLDCNSAFWAFGIKLSFMNLCNYQTTLNSIGLNNLPGKLPDGYSFVMGLNLSILNENQAIEDLPGGAGIQMDFPVLDGSQDQFAVLYWNGDGWVEVAPQDSGQNSIYRVTTTDKTGIFVLVKK